MKPLKTQISLRIKNNTNLPQPVEILSALSNPYTANNSKTLYKFDLSTEDFVGITKVNISYYIIPNPSGITSPDILLQTLSIAGIVSALNSLGLAIFSYSGTDIYASSDIYNFSNIVTS
jgi:hypothetical protein